MLTAAETFMAVANATAAIYQKCPAFATYHIHTDLHASNRETLFERDMTVRTDDQVTVVYSGRNSELGSPFPASPNYNPFGLSWISGDFTDPNKGVRDTIDFKIVNPRPKIFQSSPSNADAVARSIRGYAVTFAPDTSPELGHLLLKPMTDAVRRLSMHYTDVYYVPATFVLTRFVTEGDGTELLDASYETSSGYWLLQSLRFRRTQNSRVRNSDEFTTTYGNYRFSDTSPDPRLATPPPAPGR
jgi:hypothetical protein